MPFIIAAVALIGAIGLTALMSKGPQQPKPALFTDFTLPQSAEGTQQIIVFGDVWLDDWMVLWYGNYRHDPIYAQGKK
jgi:hypothetical protein